MRKIIGLSQTENTPSKREMCGTSSKLQPNKMSDVKTEEQAKSATQHLAKQSTTGFSQKPFALRINNQQSNTKDSTQITQLRNKETSQNAKSKALKETPKSSKNEADQNGNSNSIIKTPCENPVTESNQSTEKKKHNEPQTSIEKPGNLQTFFLIQNNNSHKWNYAIWRRNSVQRSK